MRRTEGVNPGNHDDIDQSGIMIWNVCLCLKGKEGENITREYLKYISMTSTHPVSTQSAGLNPSQPGSITKFQVSYAQDTGLSHTVIYDGFLSK